MGNVCVLGEYLLLPLSIFIAFSTKMEGTTDLFPLTFDSVPVLTVIECCNRGTESLNGLLEIFEGRLALDKSSLVFCQTVSTKNLHDLELPKSSSERTMGLLKNYYLYMASEQLKYQRKLKEGVIARLRECASARQGVMHRSKTTIETCSRDVKQAGELLSKAKQSFVRAKMEMTTQREKLASLEKAVDVAKVDRLAQEKDQQSGGDKKTFSRMLSAAFESTPEAERDKQEKRVGRRAHDLIVASADIKTRKALLTEKMSIRDFSIQQATLQLQECETQRLLCMKQTVSEFCSIERAALQEQSRLLDLLEQTVVEQQPARDIATFIQHEKRPESTLKYTKALALLDWNYLRRVTPAMAATFDGDDECGEKEGEREGEKEGEKGDKGGKEEIGGKEEVWKDSLDFDSIDVDDMAELLTLEALGDRQGGKQSPVMPDVLDTDAQQQTLAAVQAIFEAPETAEAAGSALSESQWGEMMESKELRDLFLQELDGRRGEGKLTRRGFDTMAKAMTAILNACLQADEVSSAMRIANMANTFYTIESREDDVSDAESDDSLGAVALQEASGDEKNAAVHAALEPSATAGERPPPGPDPARRRYLQREPSIRHHKWWFSEGFWEKALMEGVGKELAMVPAVRWDDLPAEALREAVLSVHNVVFGQLGSLALAMHELGLAFSEAERTVLEMSRGCVQLHPHCVPLILHFLTFTLLP